MANPTEGTTDTFSTVEDAMNSYVSDEEREGQDEGQGGPSEHQADDGQSDQQQAGPDEVTDQDPDLDDGTDEIDASDGEGQDPNDAAQGLVSHDAKVKLADGTVTTVAEIVRGTMRNADYTKGKTELAQERQKFDETRQLVRQQYETVTQHSTNDHPNIPHALAFQRIKARRDSRQRQTAQNGTGRQPMIQEAS
jgi:hypothetical protein